MGREREREREWERETAKKERVCLKRDGQIKRSRQQLNVDLGSQIDKHGNHTWIVQCIIMILH